MPVSDSQVVDLVRDLLRAHRRLASVVGQYRKGNLSFEEVRELVGNTDRSVLYRLKERCHALYRVPFAKAHGVSSGELLDLAAGALFHEAMKFREGFYQCASYGPKLELLRASDLPEAQALLPQFEKILEDTRKRSDESLAETEQLFFRITSQLPGILRSHREDGALARLLALRGQEVAELMDASEEELLCDLYGSMEKARLQAACSFLDSGFFVEALPLLRGAGEALANGLSDYAQGMAAYLDGSYVECVESLCRWVDHAEKNPQLCTVAIPVVQRAAHLVGDASRQAVEELLARLRQQVRAKGS